MTEVAGLLSRLRLSLLIIWFPLVVLAEDFRLVAEVAQVTR
jgi:hypothetical protein